MAKEAKANIPARFQAGPGEFGIAGEGETTRKNVSAMRKRLEQLRAAGNAASKAGILNLDKPGETKANGADLPKKLKPRIASRKPAKKARRKAS